MKAFRLLVFSAALIGAAYAATYTWMTHDDACKASGAVATADSREGGPPPTVDVVQKYPFTCEAIAARKNLLDAQLKNKSEAQVVSRVDDRSFFKATADNAMASFSTDGHPFVTPRNMALGAIGLLFLALILPGTRFRMTSFFMLLIGAGLALPEFMPQASRVSLFDTVSFLSPLHTHFPWVSAGVLAVALILFIWPKCSPVD